MFISDKIHNLWIPSKGRKKGQNNYQPTWDKPSELILSGVSRPALILCCNVHCLPVPTLPQPAQLFKVMEQDLVDGNTVKVLPKALMVDSGIPIVPANTSWVAAQFKITYAHDIHIVSSSCRQSQQSPLSVAPIMCRGWLWLLCPVAHHNTQVLMFHFEQCIRLFRRFFLQK